MYQDEDGNYVSLTTLCRRSPEWAANRIVKLEGDLRKDKEMRRYREDLCVKLLSYIHEGGQYLETNGWSAAVGEAILKWGRLKDTVSRLVAELRLASRPLAHEPDPMVLMPVAAWYAAEDGISGGKFRELVRLWVRGATSDELRAMLPGEEK